MRLIVKTVVIAALSVALWLYLVRYLDQNPGQDEVCKVIYVYDGDTIAMDCGVGDETARVQGLDAAETKSPGCPEELAHAELATERLRQLLVGGEVTIRRLGTNKYQRDLIRLKVDGVDVADTLIREGLAVAYDGGKRVNWCERLGAE